MTKVMWCSKCQAWGQHDDARHEELTGMSKLDDLHNHLDKKYSQADLDALTAERDQLKEDNAFYHGANEQLAKERDGLAAERGRLRARIKEQDERISWLWLQRQVECEGKENAFKDWEKLKAELERLRTQTYVCTKCGLHAHVSESPCPMCRARAELERLRAMLTIKQDQLTQATDEAYRLRAEVAELEKDKARLDYLEDWLEKVKFNDFSDVRQAIDAAMADPERKDK